MFDITFSVGTIGSLQTGARDRARHRVRRLMLRVTTIYASSAGASADYYTKYLTGAPGEVPGVWAGAAKQLRSACPGTVDTESLKRLLEGRDPVSGSRLGRALVDRVTVDGRVIKAVSGFDATLSAPKSVSRVVGVDRRRTVSGSP